MLKTLKNCCLRLVKAMLFAIIILVMPLVGHRAHKHYLYDYKGNSVVRLIGHGMGRASGGTGFQVVAPSGKQYTLTNYHVCMLANKNFDGSESLQAEDYKHRKTNIKVIKHSKNHDLCLLEPVLGLPVIEQANKYFLHEQVHLIGHPRLANLTIESGSIVSKRIINIALPTKSDHDCKTPQIRNPFVRKQSFKVPYRYHRNLFKTCYEELPVLHINVISYGGNSGSPVVDDLGRLIGVLFAGNRNAVTAAFVVPLEYVKQFLSNQ